MTISTNKDSAHTRWWQIGEVVFGLPFLVAVGLHLWMPLPILPGFLAPLRLLAGIALIVIGVAWIARARREFGKRGQPTDPGQPTTSMVTTGVFSFSRNPIYLGAVLFLAGVSLVFNMLWGLILLLPSLVACHYVLIAPEEKYLAARFGAEYRKYAAAVHRWLGRRSSGES